MTGYCAPTVLRTSRFCIALPQQAARALLHHDYRNDSTASRIRSLYAIHLSLSVVIPAIQPRLRLSVTNRLRSAFHGGQRKKALNILGYPVSRNKARKLMREAGVSVKQRKKHKVTTNSNHKQPVFKIPTGEANLMLLKIDQTYAADVTYIWTRDGWLYLAVVIDLCLRKVVGWSMSSRMKAQLVCDALTMAIWHRHPKSGLIHHLDRKRRTNYRVTFQGNN
ncbi:MAG: DDE-type integrase/transposase/recombinase [Candidatus Thiodiazotropha sp. (ex Lucinoma aequizonata)]|nr:DDE-type integrase/transposase/recombinase [Candidatus Thiodiazotropha sp. (ex Lucinoma aequizonata)]